jgi:hypothetical protein
MCFEVAVVATMFAVGNIVFGHLEELPRKGINGWTGEPKDKYYALRGWKLPGQRGAAKMDP